MTDNVYWVLRAEVGQQGVRPIQELAKRFCEQTKQEHGTLDYEWSFNADQTQLHVYERYADSAAALTHIQNVGPLLPEFMALTQNIRFEVYGEVSEEIKGALSELDVQYFQIFEGFHR